MKKILVLLAFLTASASQATVVGMLYTSPANRIAIETVMDKGKPFLVIKRWGRNCPIQFARGTPFSSEWQKTDNDGQKYLILSLFDGPPQTEECPVAQEDKPGIRVFPVDKLLSSKALAGAHADFFEGDAKIALVFQEQPPGGYDGRMNGAEFKLSAIKDTTTVVYETPWKNSL